MKQLIQYFRTGELELIDCPVPTVSPRHLIIKSTNSLISVGTEKMLIDFGKASFIKKAKQQPDKVKQVLDKIKTDGMITTFEAVWSKLNDPIPLGYSNVGIITDQSEDISEFKLGDRVVSNGHHAEFVKVPCTLACRIPEAVSDEEAAFTVPGAISLEGIRLLNPTMGETVVVIGLGLLGQLTCALLNANGCKVIGLDIDAEKVALAKQRSIISFLSKSKEENIKIVMGETDSKGADGVIITASTASEDLLSQCALMCRKRGRIILVGVIPITVPRNLFYEKELSFQVSSAYGPGRYDAEYEEKGRDYPLPYVRWTAKRNMEAFLLLLELNKLSVNNLVTHRFEFNKIHDAYNAIETDAPLGIIINYPDVKIVKGDGIHYFKNDVSPNKDDIVCLGFIGAGNFARSVLLPSFVQNKVRIKMISSSDGLQGSILAKRFNIESATSEKENVFLDNEINTVCIATRHASHTPLVLKAIKAGKHVFVEKPLSVTLEELMAIKEELNNLNTKLKILVGFNRRFSIFSSKLKTEIQHRNDPVSMIMTVNAGMIPMDHWVHDPEVGGGRIIGEVCHFVDLARYLTDSPIKEVVAKETSNHSGTNNDKVMILLTFDDGSNCTIHYLANGHKRFPKERIEVFSAGKIFVIDNFINLKAFGSSLKYKSLRQEKGHAEEIKGFIKAIEKNRPDQISINEIFEVHLATLAIGKSIEQKKIVTMQSMWKLLNNNKNN